jgi:hypothetical protein
MKTPRREVSSFTTRLDHGDHTHPLGPSHSSAWCGPCSKPRQRVCLLKGCERPYRPSHPLDRYCSDKCREAARRWTRYRANRRYRHSEQGKQRRREQCRRYRRQRCQDRSADHGSAPVTKAGGEGYQGRRDSGIFLCDRPGCYEAFAKTARSPAQRFCSCSCRTALRRVLVRERRWLRSLRL